MNEAALLRNVSNRRQFVPQVSNMAAVTLCSGKHNGLWLILMYAAHSLGNTLSVFHRRHLSLHAVFYRPTICEAVADS